MEQLERNRMAGKQILLMLMTVPLALFFMGVILPKLPSSPMLKESFWASKVSQRPAYDIVFIGDSRVYRGIDPSIIEEATGSKCFNFGFSSAGLDSIMIYKALALLNPKGKKQLVIAISPNAFMPSSLNNEHLKSKTSDDIKTQWIKQHLYPTIHFFDAYSIADVYKWYKGEAYDEEFRSESGYVASDRIPFDSSLALSAYKKQFETEKPDIKSVTAFIGILETLRNRGIQIEILRVPTSNAMRQLEDNLTGHLIDSIKLKLEQKGFKILKTNQSNYYSYDGSHLDKSSSQLYSIELAKQLIK